MDNLVTKYQTQLFNSIETLLEVEHKTPNLQRKEVFKHNFGALKWIIINRVFDVFLCRIFFSKSIISWFLTLGLASHTSYNAPRAHTINTEVAAPNIINILGNKKSTTQKTQNRKEMLVLIKAFWSNSYHLILAKDNVVFTGCFGKALLHLMQLW